MRSYGLFDFRELLLKPINYILSVEGKTNFVGVIRLFLYFEFNVFGLEILFVFWRIELNRIARKGFAEQQRADRIKRQPDLFA